MFMHISETADGVKPISGLYVDVAKLEDIPHTPNVEAVLYLLPGV